ncbi:hypothetical protein LTY36_01145 [Limosilactobacillus agrestis]|uniref:Uncharacterized protein n=1 Tax=Limosilactobacillus agrestis TaxID=2759748 RepID=A0A7W3UGH3_9LACO|nr:hypothetical protein [Limosilactobacillus agrestis]MBB1095179.1 hypothetical protein [Limosilactobacillus agrestis]MCD7129828.1 hypothetical protein [Limosilactobacillus agrestis]
MIYLILIIFIVSSLLAFLMRAFDIYVSFLDEGIKLPRFDSLKILFLLTKNFIKIIKPLFEEKDWSSIKIIFKFYIFNFNLVITLLVSITKEAKLAVEKDKPTFIKAGKKSSILEIIRNSIPFFNEKQKDIAFA